MKKSLPYILAILVITLIAGAGAYWWQGKNHANKNPIMYSALGNSPVKTFEDKENLGLRFNYPELFQETDPEFATECDTESNFQKNSIVFHGLEIKNVAPFQNIHIRGVDGDGCEDLGVDAKGLSKNEFEEILSKAKNDPEWRVIQGKNLEIPVHIVPFFGVEAIIHNPNSKYETIYISWEPHSLRPINFMVGNRKVSMQEYSGKPYGETLSGSPSEINDTLSIFDKIIESVEIL